LLGLVSGCATGPSTPSSLELPRGPMPEIRYVVEAVRVEGNTKTSSSLIESLVDLPQGRPVSVQELEPLKRRLLGTGYFSGVEARLDRGSERGRVVVVIEVEERNTIILSDIILGSSREHPFWGGLDVAEGNLFGRGLVLGGAFVVGEGQSGFRGQLADPFAFLAPLRLSSEVHHVSADEAFYTRGSEVGGESEAGRLRSTRTGGEVGLGFYPLALLGVFVDVGVEGIEASSTAPTLMAPWLRDGRSFNRYLRLTLDHDTRDDPLVPRSGYRLNVSLQAGDPTWGSSYSYLKAVLRTSYYQALAFGAVGHVLRFDLFGGTIVGDAPYHERFFVGDVSSLVASRDLSMSFSARPSPDFFDRGAGDLGYETVMAGAGVEYGVPIMQGPAPFYRVEFFIGTGVFGMTTPGDLPGLRAANLGIDALGTSRPTVFPVDLTFDVGFRAETPIGVFGLSFGNGLALVGF